MKKYLFSAAILFATLTPATTAVLEQDTVQPEQKIEAGSSITLPAKTPNQVVHGKLVYSGVFVQLVTSDKPLDLINPLAPADAGQASDNTAYDLISNKSNGIKLFSISF